MSSIRPPVLPIRMNVLDLPIANVLAKSSCPTFTIVFLYIGGAPASSQATNLVPFHTAYTPCRETSAVAHGTGTDDQYGSTSERRFLSPGFVHNGQGEDRSGHVASVSAFFTSFESLRDMLEVTDDLVDGGRRKRGLSWVI